MHGNLNASPARLTIEEIVYHLPARIVSNEDIQVREPQWDMKRVAERTGVLSRRFAADSETALDLSYQACLKLFEQHPKLPSKIGALIFCTQSPDHLMPPNSCILHKKLELGDQVAAFDFNLACSGYTYGLAIAQGLMSAGFVSDALLVTADTYSKYISSKDRSVYSLFGDGAAVSWLKAGAKGATRGLVDVLLATSGKDYETFIVPAGGCRLPRSSTTAALEADIAGKARSKENIHMQGLEVLNFVKAKVPGQVREILERNGLDLSEIDLIVPHQASRTALEALAKLLGADPSRMYSNITHVGNTVSASIPMALKDAESAGRLKRGDLVMMIGFGVGLSYATALIRY